MKSDYYAKIISDDGLISDFEFEQRIHNTSMMDDLLDLSANQFKHVSIPELAAK